MELATRIDLGCEHALPFSFEQDDGPLGTFEQGLLGGTDPRDAPNRVEVPGKHRERITDVTTTGETTLRLTVDPSGYREPHAYEPRVVHHHQPELLQHLWDERRDGAFVAGAHLALIGTPRVHTAFSVSRSPIDPCRTDTAEWLETAGADGDARAGAAGAAADEDGGAG